MIHHKMPANKLGIIGWAFGGRWGLERYLYTLHRATGVGLLFYFLIHIFVTSSRLFGKDAWEAAMQIVSNPLFHFGELLVYIAFCFHALNGVRLVLIEFGFAVGKPEEPVYPYRSSLNTQRPLMIIVMLAAGVSILLGGIDILILGPSP
jgi:succinate dehydrogenase / fumarate reductase cytochrome b subunit